MKIGICIVGLYRDKLSTMDVKDITKTVHDQFPDADFYYHTWDSEKNNIPLQYHENLYTCPEPQFDYHPVADCKNVGKHGKFSNYKKHKLLHNKTAHGSKQILGYADLLSKIPYKDYDILIRLRWDVLIVKPISELAKFYDYAMNTGPVGVMTRKGRTTDHDRTAVEVNQDETKPELSYQSNFENDDWYGYLADTLIMHSPKHFDPKYVNELHNKKELHPVEWGWYQVMSEPFGDNHKSVHNIARIVR